MEFSAKESIRCLFCNFKCNINSQLERHMSKHTLEKPSFCDKCNRGFSCTGAMRLHIKTVHQGIKRVHKKIQKCSLCSFATHVRLGLEEHIRTHTRERSFPCQQPNCEYRGKCATSVRRHTINKHTNAARNFLCSFPNCDYRGKTPWGLKRHFLSHSDHRSFVCDVDADGCSYRAKRRDTLKNHQGQVHHGGYKPFGCSKCDYRTPLKHMLTKHRKSHVQEDTVKCAIDGCSYSSKSISALHIHVRSCHEDQEKKFKCDIGGCPAEVASLCKLQRHKKSVHSEKAYKCPRCDYRAMRPWQIQKHIAISHEEKTVQRIPCPTVGCKFRAPHQYSLKMHMQHHEENLFCQIEGCGHVAASKAGWNLHVKVHDPTDRPFHCPFCPQHFKTSSQVSRHISWHTKEKPIKCPLCNFGATIKSTITKHVRRIHPTALSGFVYDRRAICDHCNVNFTCALGVEIHRMKLKTAVVVLPRLQIVGLNTKE